MGPASRVESSPAVALRAYVGAFSDELVRAGLTDVCLCPGSRSTPLAIILRQQAGLRVWMHLDERSAAFFALGMARAQGRPVAVAGTSGTAVLNFAPAVAEARQGHVPLLVLTADRPPELRGIGSNQTIDQLRLYGAQVKWSEEMLLPEAGPAATRYVRAIADRAISTASAAPAGPVHLNFPFREPLIPADPEPARETQPGPTVKVSRAQRRPRSADLETLANELALAPKGLIVCGPLDKPDFPAAVTDLAQTLDWPILADVLSQVRTGPQHGDRVIENFDAFLRHRPTAESLEPEVILRFGATPISKPLSQYLEANTQSRQIIIAEDDTWLDPQQAATDFLYADPAEFCLSLGDALLAAPISDNPARQEWRGAWLEARQLTRQALDQSLAQSDRMSESTAISRLAGLLPENAVVFAGNSMPVRDLDSFFPRSNVPFRFMANRGVSGIDGVISSALGAAAASQKPLVLIIGDISLYHDSNGLLAAQRYGDRLNATIILINNDGGGIFSFLPQVEQPEHFEELFGTPHGLEFGHLAAMYGLAHEITSSAPAFDAAVAKSLASPGVSLVEIRTERDTNRQGHAENWQRVADSLEAATLATGKA